MNSVQADQLRGSEELIGKGIAKRSVTEVPCQGGRAARGRWACQTQNVRRLLCDDRQCSRQRRLIVLGDGFVTGHVAKGSLNKSFMGRVVGIGARQVTIGGQYVLGTGFMGLGVVLASAVRASPRMPKPAPSRTNSTSSAP